jgi:O-antigen ligase
MVTYKVLKPRDAEMARLAHNDFLQQGSDSGWVGLVAFAGWLLGGLWILYRRSSRGGLKNAGIWLGLAGVMVQSLVEFGFYIPAIAWPTCFLLGWGLAGADSPAVGLAQARRGG